MYSFCQKLLYYLQTIPYFGIIKFSEIVAGKERQFWKKLRLAQGSYPKILPDGSRMFCSWVDYGIFWDAVSYDQFYIPSMGETVIDAGAHIGFYTLRASKRVGENGRVIAVEPERRNFQTLKKNVLLYGLGNVALDFHALCDTEGKAEFYLKAQSVSHSLLNKEWKTPIVGSSQVLTTTVDCLVKKHHLGQIDLLKLNIEGAELLALKGCVDLLRDKRILRIVIPLHPPFIETARQVSRLLSPFGFKTIEKMQTIFATLP